MTKIGGKNDGRLLANKRLVKRADVLRRNMVKFKAVIPLFIVVSDRLRRSELSTWGICRYEIRKIIDKEKLILVQIDNQFGLNSQLLKFLKYIM